MAELLKGKAASDSIAEGMMKDIEELSSKGITPTVAVVRVGERPDDIKYENSIKKKCDTLGIQVVSKVLTEAITTEELLAVIDDCNEATAVHGILLFRPLPKHLDEELIRNSIAPNKDIDAATDLSLAGVFAGNGTGYPPCTAQSAMEILRYYNVPMAGKKAVVLGRSLVIGRPVAMMLMEENATVTICHSKTQNVEKIAAEADILIAAMGRAGAVTEAYTNPGQTIIDVGINWDAELGKIVGDVAFESVEPQCFGITPVPGGVGTVTTTILLSHVVDSAKKMC